MQYLTLLEIYKSWNLLRGRMFKYFFLFLTDLLYYFYFFWCFWKMMETRWRFPKFWGVFLVWSNGFSVSEKTVQSWSKNENKYANLKVSFPNFLRHMIQTVSKLTNTKTDLPFCRSLSSSSQHNYYSYFINRTNFRFILSPKSIIIIILF